MFELYRIGSIFNDVFLPTFGNKVQDGSDLRICGAGRQKTIVAHLDIDKPKPRKNEMNESKFIDKENIRNHFGSRTPVSAQASNAQREQLPWPRSRVTISK